MDSAVIPNEGIHQALNKNAVIPERDSSSRSE